MTKLYAIVSPAFSKTGDHFIDLPALLVSPFHQFAYEQVCGYSLGHEVVFFDKIEDAKMSLETGIKSSKAAAKMAKQQAIIELEANDERKITGFSAIHTADVEKQYEQFEKERFFKAVRIAVWKEQVIDPSKDVSEGALDEMNRQYESIKVATESTQATL